MLTKFSGVLHEEVSGFDSRSRKNVMLLWTGEVTGFCKKVRNLKLGFLMGDKNTTMLWDTGIWHLAAGTVDMDQLLIKWSLSTKLTTSTPRRP